MSSYLNTKFPYYPARINSKKPLGNISLRNFIKAVSEPKDNVKQLFLDIKKAAADGDMKLKTKLKEKLYYFNPCINSDGKGRSYDNITSFTGLAQIDFDKIPNAMAMRDWFFENCKSCAVCGLSPSGLGIKSLVRIPVVKTVDEYKSYYYGLGYYLEELKGYDISPQNPVLPLYLFYDPNTRWREDATISTVRGEKINSFNTDNIKEGVDIGYVPWFKKKRIMDIFSNGIDNIDDNGHPQVVKYATALGGYVGASYLSEDDAFDLIEDKISNNEYLSKNPKGYIRTAKDMMLKGMSAPLYLKEDET